PHGSAPARPPTFGARSTIIVRRPRRARSNAAVIPAMPAPVTMKSTSRLTSVHEAEAEIELRLVETEFSIAQLVVGLEDDLAEGAVGKSKGVLTHVESRI